MSFLTDTIDFMYKKISLFQNFDYKLDAIIVGYILFIISLALEFSVNEFRTFALLCLFVSLSGSPYLRQSLIRSEVFKLSLLFPVIALFAWLFGPHGSDGLKTFDWLFVFAIGYIAALTRPRESILLLLVLPIAILLASLVAYILTIVGYLRLEDLFYGATRLKLYSKSTNRMGFTLAAALAICCGLATITGRHRLLTAALIPIFFVLCWMTQSRSAFLAITGVLIVYIFNDALSHRKKLSWMLLVPVVIVVTIIISGNNRISQTLTSGSLEFLFNGREDIWRASWEIFLKSPIFGFGVDSFHDTLSEHLAILGNEERFPGLPVPNIFWNAHQIILGVLAEMGVAGLLVFIFITVRGLRNGFRCGPEALAPLLVLIAYLIVGIGGYGFHRSWNSAFFFLSLGLIEGVHAARKNHSE